MAVYFLKFESPAGDPSRPRMSARYYVGWVQDEFLPRRIKMHRTGIWDGEGGGGCPALTSWFRDQGISFDVVRILWGLSRDDERRIKRGGHFDRYDPTVSSDLSPRGVLYVPGWVEDRRYQLDSQPTNEVHS